MKNVKYINAGAGSGKTYTLTTELTRLISEEHIRPEQVIMTTFTIKAASEFKAKAKARLHEAGLHEEAGRLDQALIGTIHSVCQRMIGKYWYYLGLSPQMNVMDDNAQKFYTSQSLATLPTPAERDRLNAFVRFFGIRGDARKGEDLKFRIWQDQLKDIISGAINYEITDFSRSLQESLGFLRQFVKSGDSLAAFDSVLAGNLKGMLAEARANAVDTANPASYMKIYDEIEGHQNDKDINWYKLVLKNLTVGKRCPSYKAVCAQLKTLPIWTTEEVYKRQAEYLTLLFTLAGRWRERFLQFKRDNNLLDFNDMEHYMLQLLENPAIADEIAQSYRYLFVDEFQDSSPIQVKIFDALSDLMEHSYWVGDYKQAVYRFRGSDIALTKAVVDRVARKQNGCDTDRLDTSWRSLPDIVELNNRVFCETFKDVLAPQDISLNPKRTNDSQVDSLRYFVVGETGGVAEHIGKLLSEGALPHEIAVLARDNATLGTLAEELKTRSIPASRENYPVTGSKAYQLVASLLRLVGNDRDNLAKATVAFLTDPHYDTRRLIEEKLLSDADPETRAGYLASVPLISQLLTIRPRLRQQSVAALVESMVIELNLYNVVKRMEEPSFAGACLQTIVSTARVYEEHCVQMNLPATIDGFIAYIAQVNPTGSGDPTGVQLHTYHSCKGLQWKYVILLSLNTHVADLKKAVASETYGVHPVHETTPSADNPYPEVYIRLTPWVYGGGKTVPDEISVRIEGSDDFRRAYRDMLAETNRVLYVGMTRPRDVLILAIEEPKTTALLQWPKDDGVSGAASTIPAGGDWDVLGARMPFRDMTLTADEAATLAKAGQPDAPSRMQLRPAAPTFTTAAPRYVSPSSIHTCGKAVNPHDFQARIPLSSSVESMATVGDCIHQIFAGIEEPRPAGQTDLRDIIASYGLSAVLTDPQSILQAWQNLAGRLTLLHGPALSTCHERPFRLERRGQTIVGSIDLVWQTAEGDLLIDFKTFPGSEKVVSTPASPHFVGRYAGQLGAYKEALEAAGERVLKSFIYYPVAGLLVELAPPPSPPL